MCMSEIYKMHGAGRRRVPGGDHARECIALAGAGAAAAHRRHHQGRRPSESRMHLILRTQPDSMHAAWLLLVGEGMHAASMHQLLKPWGSLHHRIPCQEGQGVRYLAGMRGGICPSACQSSSRALREAQCMCRCCCLPALAQDCCGLLSEGWNFFAACHSSSSAMGQAQCVPCLRCMPDQQQGDVSGLVCPSCCLPALPHRTTAAC